MTTSTPKRVIRQRKSLWREISDGTAGVGVLLAMSLAAAFCLTAVTIALSYLMSLWSGPYPGHIRDEMLTIIFLFAGLAYLVVLYWLWRRSIGARAVVLAISATIAIWISVPLLWLLIDQMFPADKEVLMLSAPFMAGAFTVLLWVQVWRRYNSRRPLRDTTGQIDVTCPECGYSMSGLKESRCPECGHQCTIDQLIAQQNYEAHADAAKRGS
jgi:hypothetical protein